jgi:hypothetical protein
MRMTRLFLGVAGLLVAGDVLGAPAAAKPKLLVMPATIDVSAKGKLPTTFDEVILTAVSGRGVYQVFGPSDLNTVLNLEKQRDLLGCDESKCITEIGGALGADKLLSVQVAKIDDAWLVTTKLIDVAGITVEHGRVRS